MLESKGKRNKVAKIIVKGMWSKLQDGKGERSE
jgi:hypothetical protein